MMTPKCVNALGRASTAMPEATAMVAVRGVEAMERAMPVTAWKTTATAAASRPSVQLAEVASKSRANAAMSANEGQVNMSQAIAMPEKPARW